MSRKITAFKGIIAATIIAGSVGIGGSTAQADDAHHTTPPTQLRPAQMGPRNDMPRGQMRQGQMGPMMMQNMMRGMMMGMMRGMMGRGPMGMMMGRRMTDRKLDAAEVKRILDGRLAWQGNKRLKVGTVTEKDDNTVIAEIQTVDGSLVAKWTVDRATGRMRYAE